MEEELSRKHGVVSPEAIIFFGPPGTGKTHFAFEQELVNKENYLVTEETFMHILPKVPPSSHQKVIDEFEKDSVSFARI